MKQIIAQRKSQISTNISMWIRRGFFLLLSSAVNYTYTFLNFTIECGEKALKKDLLGKNMGKKR